MKKSLLKTCRCAYLYPDGHCVLWHLKKDKRHIETQWVTLHKKFPVPVWFKHGGRLIIQPQALPMLLAAKRVSVSAPTLSNGSQQSKAKEIPVGTLELDYGNGPTFIYLTPSILSGDVEYMLNHSEVWEDIKDKYSWGDMQIDRMNSDYGEAEAAAA